MGLYNSKRRKRGSKEFLHFCMQYFRQALLLNYTMKELVYLEPSFDNFKLEKFALLFMVAIVFLSIKKLKMPSIILSETEIALLF